MRLQFKILLITGALITAGLSGRDRRCGDRIAHHGHIYLRLR